MKKIITKYKISKIAKELCPDILMANIIERDNLLILNLKKKKFPKSIESSFLLSMHHNKIPLDKNDYEVILNRIKSKIQESILEFGKEESDLIIDKFKLNSIYEDKYQDKNIMYKVPYIYKRTIHTREIRKSLSLHYFDEIKLSLPNMYYFWILLRKRNFKHEKIEAIFDMTNSIIERIKQFSFSNNLIKNIINEAQNLGNPDTFFIFYYHFTYFISLAKSIGDNLAWMVNLYYKLNLTFFNIDLLNEKFKNSLHNQKHLVNSIYSNQYFNDYTKLNKFRDIIQHRHIIGAMRILNTETRQYHILIPINPEFLIDENLRTNESNEFKKIIAENVNSAIFNGTHDYYLTSNKEIEKKFDDPIRFCEKNMEGLFNLVDSVFRRMVIELTRQKIGEVRHFYSKKSVAIIDLTNSLGIRDKILIEGNTTSFLQEVESMEIDLKKFEKVDNGSVGIKVIKKVRCNDAVYKVKKIDNNTFQKYI